MSIENLKTFGKTNLSLLRNALCLRALEHKFHQDAQRIRKLSVLSSATGTIYISPSSD